VLKREAAKRDLTAKWVWCLVHASRDLEQLLAEGFFG